MLRVVFRQNLSKFFTTNSVHLNRLFTKEHEWLLLDCDKKAGKVGITNHAQSSLGDIVYIELPKINSQLKKGDECGALESVKAASEIYSPVTGRIVEKNDNVEDNPSLINKSCDDQGWLFKITVDKAEELSSLLTEDGYAAFLKLKE